MKIKYLGTAAAEGIPALFCNCRVCRFALENKGIEVKTRSQAIVDNKILIDFPADTYMHMLHGGLDLKNVKHCLITHCHHDHLYETDFWCRKKGIANKITEEPLNVYLTQAGYNIVANSRFGLMEDGRVVFHIIEPFEPFFIEDYRIIPLKAEHDPQTNPVIYIIERGDKALLYANDTGVFGEETLEYLKKYNRTFNLVSLDCTSGDTNSKYPYHMTLKGNKKTMKMLRKLDVCNDETVVYVNHFSHNANATHYEMVKAASDCGYKVSYDGLEVEI